MRLTYNARVQCSALVFKTRGWDSKPIFVPSIALGMDLVVCQIITKTSFFKIGCKNPWLLYIKGRPGLYRKPYFKCKKKILQKQGKNMYFRIPVLTKDIRWYWIGSMGATFSRLDLFSHKLKWKPIFIVYSSYCFISTFFLVEIFLG